MNVERRDIVQHEYLITLDETEAATLCRLMGLRNSLERFCTEFHGEWSQKAAQLMESLYRKLLGMGF